ncbi:unnamed protein product [Rotaria socialis]|uniref:Microbial-type PARG catalytic domain-containing protein n=2 Tax=Rotaria socialis TaxID=392032 RepID=A0A820ZPJ1_9BILA|nr:unnamed protein product [Rotaria socialis]
MTFFLLSSCHSHATFLTRSLIFLSFSQRLTRYNMTNSNAYLPLHALRKVDIYSMLSVAFPSSDQYETERKYDYHHSRRTMLYFLKLIYDKPNNQAVIDLINKCSRRVDLKRITNDYMTLKKINEPYREQHHSAGSDDYWELKSLKRPGPLKSLEYISKYREKGFNDNELKIYWNYDEIKRLNEDDYFNPIADQDSHDALQQSPVKTRKNPGKIQFIQSGIEQAVFQVPPGKQVIVLDFADERMPGGYFLENARTQEEVILYNSDGYRGLLDLKYKLMDGGYILPEYGVAYIKKVVFFQKSNPNERETDLIVAACYDLSGMGEGLYKPPSREKYQELYDHTYQKFQAIIASAVANTHGNGQDTYLLLGPIGTGAFANDMKMVAGIFSKILNAQLMDSEQAIRYAFDQIWFVSIDNLESFKKHVQDET